MKRVVSLLILTLLLQGCATSARNISKDFVLQPNSNMGIVLGSVTAAKADGTQGGNNVVANFLFKNGDENNYRVESRLESIPGLTLEASEFEDGNGRLFVVAVPSGVYDLYNWHLAQGNVFVRPKGSLKALSFEIKEGAVTYVGNWHMHFTQGNWGISKPVNGGIPEIRDYYERDSKHFLDRYPLYEGKEFIDGVPKLGIWSNSSTERELIVPVPIL